MMTVRQTDTLSLSLSLSHTHTHTHTHTYTQTHTYTHRSINEIHFACCWVGLAVGSDNTECTDTGCLGTVYRYGSKCTGIPEPTQGAELSLSLSLSLSHMHAHAHTHARTHTHIMHTLPPSSPHPFSDVSFSFLLPTCHLVFLPSLSLCLSLLPIIMPLAATTSVAKWLRRLPRERKIQDSNPACAGIFLGRVIPVT